MGTFAETAMVDYRLSFAGLGKQTFVFRFRLQQNVSLPFPFAICRKQTEVLVFRFRNSGNMETMDMETWRHKDMET
jgi:hypothetical protein